MSMNADDFRASVVLRSLWFISEVVSFDPDTIAGVQGTIEKTSESGYYRLCIESNVIRLKLRDADRAAELDFHLMRGMAQVAEVKDCIMGSGVLNLCTTVQFFAGSLVAMGNVGINIDRPNLWNAVIALGLVNMSAEDAVECLNQSCALGKCSFLFRPNVSDEDDVVSDSSHAVGENSEHKAVFFVYVPQYEIAIERRENGGIISYHVKEIVLRCLTAGDIPFRMASGTLNFVMSEDDVPASDLVQDVLNKMTKDTGSFLARWDLYSREEGNLLLEKARKIGLMTVQNVESAGDSWVLWFDKVCDDSLKVGDAVVVIGKTGGGAQNAIVVPLYMQNSTIDWQEYQRLEKEKEKAGHGKSKVRSALYEVLKIKENSITVKGEDEIENMSVIMLSIIGEEVQIKRRDAAHKAVLMCLSANPALASILGDGQIPQANRTTHIEPTSEMVNQKIFHGQLTDRQREAIDIALNTPDIALIQGPPGTGKTTVICAILERLNEISDKTSSMKGRYLVSSSQHVAIENLTSRLSINSMPAIKGDKRASKGSSDEEDENEVNIDAWVAEHCEKLKERNPKLQESMEIKAFREGVNHYMANPSDANKRALLKCILSMPRSIVSAECVQTATEMCNDQTDEDALSFDNELVSRARALRTHTESAADDGERTAALLAESLERKGITLEKDDEDALNTAIAGGEKALTSQALKALRRVKKNVLSMVIPRPVWHTAKISGDVLELIDEVQSAIKYARGGAQTKDAVLAEFYGALCDNGTGLRNSIMQYSPVYSLTVQHAGSDKYTKDIKNSENKVVYDTVIIDEAARVSPLDLLIPLSQAQKRIILVGDHRQLPQMVEENVIEKLERGESIDRAKLKQDYEESLFQHLFTKRLKELTRQDGIVRTVTLDAQYRMHPLLGKFVSDHFYKDDGGFRSPRAESDFAFDYDGGALPGARPPVMWLDVPYSRGGEKRVGTAFVNESEAFSIADKAASWMEADALKQGNHKRLTFAVICMYKAQVDAVQRCMERHGLMERQGDAFVYTSQARGLLEVGTVDAFQGKEFDVVFLSLVRSNARGNFGFLKSPNRLCVAMSRQKKMLVAAGDSQMYSQQKARIDVPSLYDFYALCAKREAVINGR